MLWLQISCCHDGCDGCYGGSDGCYVDSDGGAVGGVGFDGYSYGVAVVTVMSVMVAVLLFISITVVLSSLLLLCIL